MWCPYCLNVNTKVIDSRLVKAKQATRRRRSCIKCKKRFTTYETVELPDIYVVKKTGTREPFNYGKLFNGVSEACEKRPVKKQQIESLVDSIERDLRRRAKHEISSRKIGEMVMRRLTRLDKVAYIRFASVYYEFDDISEFAKQIRELKKKKM